MIDHADLKTLFPAVSIADTLSSTIRACLKAPPGKRWCVADLTSIESVGAAWLAGCDSILDIFHHGRDTYKTFASQAFRVPYDEVTKEQRTFSKPAVLGGAYQLSGPGLVAYAAGMGVDMTEEDGAEQITAFRDTYHEIPHYWFQLKRAAIDAVLSPHHPVHAYAVDGCDSYNNEERVYRYRPWPKVTYLYDGQFLRCYLPSQRVLWYYKPRVDHAHKIRMRDGTTFTVQALLYWGIDQHAAGNQWREISTHGGKLLENITQALCRDVLWNGLELAEEDPDFEVVGDVYDELLTLIEAGPDEQAKLQRLVEYMTTRPSWADEKFFLGADGYVADRYRKD